MTSDVGTLTYNTGALTFNFRGPAFRLIPHASTEPLSTSYSLGGGRWNATNTFEVMYAFTDTTTARQYMAAQESEAAFSWLEVAAERQLDLVVIEWNLSDLTDLASNDGLAVYHLPPTYPAGFQARTSWPMTQPIGAAIHRSGSPGLVVRSASATDFSRPPINWAELAIFPERAPLPTLIERVAFDIWYAG